MPNSKPQIIIGAGLVGCLFAIMLRKRGHPVDIYEKRPNLRRGEGSEGRSINLVITTRGIAALEEAGLWEEVSKLCVPVSGRMIHSPEGKLAFTPYGRDGECNYSVSRGELNLFLIEQVERLGGRIFFESPLERVDFERKVLRLENGEERSFGRLYGADGANSVVRRDIPGVNTQRETLPSVYKEFLMPAAPSGDYPMEKKALHIWPRGEHMLMGLPNTGGSFTMTLYLPKSLEEELVRENRAHDFFRRHYSDALDLAPQQASEFSERPSGTLGTVRCHPWHWRDEAVLLGDAAHAIVPFFGQGMNCGFEDCRLLMDFLNRAETVEQAFARFDRFQRANGNAIADMALENFVEMRDKVGDANFLLRKRVDSLLENKWRREYRTRYAMVVYTHIPYALAQAAGKIQQGILDELCEGLTRAEDVDWERAKTLISDRMAPFIQRHGITF